MKSHATMPSMLVTSRLDLYGNLLIQGLPSKDKNRLQRLPNRAAKLIFMATKSEHVSTGPLRQLHRLPIHQCIGFKWSTITCTYKCMSDSCPPLTALNLSFHLSLVTHFILVPILES